MWNDDLLVEITIACPKCEADVALAGGLDPDETMWMHEMECAEWQPEDELPLDRVSCVNRP
jgi:hypothetical protein